MKIAEFFQKMLSDSGEVSFSRFASLCALFFVLGWFTGIIIKDGKLVDTATVLGYAGFIAALYAIGKTNETISGK